MTPATALRQALEAGVTTPTTFRGLFGLFGDSTAQIAIALAGTRDKRSNAYKAALRNVQRYRKGDRRPSAATLSKLQSAAAPRAMRRHLDDIKANGLTATVIALVLVSSDERWRSVEAQYVPPDALHAATVNGLDFFQLAEAGRWGGAADAFGEAFFGPSAYGIGLGARMAEVDDLTIAPG